MHIRVDGLEGRMCIPSLQYQHTDSAEYREDRLPSPFVLVYKESTAWSFFKDNPATFASEPLRKNGDQNYLHFTDISSLGFEDGSFVFSWPYSEKEGSTLLDHRGTAPKAFFPVDELSSPMVFSFSLSKKCFSTFSEAIFHAFSHFFARNPIQEDTYLPLSQAVELKRESLKKTYRQFSGGAGFFFHFDPRKGYASLPAGFGTTFSKIPKASYSHVLEYGFTGRQINAAFLLAKKNPDWVIRSEQIVDFFADTCFNSSGWLYSLYDCKTETPVYSFGDPCAPCFHYVWKTNEKGNYLRTMTEPVFDLLRCYQLFLELGIEKSKWKERIDGFVSFLQTFQNEDGSWYRGYQPDGHQAVIDKEIPKNAEAEKSATAVPLQFLCAFSRCFPEKACLPVIRKAADYLLRTAVENEVFVGGTMDNPNIIDKEAAQYAMAALFSCYELFKEPEYLNGAKISAYQFLSWNYTWNAPNQIGTALEKQHFRTRGMGGINSIWGGGVVDIYSLFHIKELFLLGKTLHEQTFCDVAREIAISSTQFISHPGCSFGFVDYGMQPEGWGICSQGIDEGLIHKGDTWGSLGWIYSATIDGISRFEEMVCQK